MTTADTMAKEKYSNVDPSEIKKFADLSSRWWDKQGEFRALHEINPLRFAYIDERCYLKDKTVVDIGCGGGILSESMARCGASVVGADLGKSPLSVARLHAINENLEIDYQNISAEEMAQQQPASFDVITCMEMLEHVPNPSSIIKACGELVKPGGQVFFSTINRNPKSYLLAVLGAEYILRLLPQGTHDYERFIKPSELDRWARAAQLELVDIKGISYNPLSSLFRISNDIDVNYMACYSRPE